VQSQAIASFELKEAEIAVKKATDQQKLAEAEAKDKETWQKKLDSLEDEHLKNIEEKRKEIDEARYTAEQQIVQLQMKQFEEIKGKTESLLHTLFTNPKSFGKQLETTVRDAALKPVEDKISTSLSKEIYKMLHHGELPGTKLADLKVGTVDDAMKVYVNQLAEYTRNTGRRKCRRWWLHAPIDESTVKQPVQSTVNALWRRRWWRVRRCETRKRANFD